MLFLRDYSIIPHYAKKKEAISPKIIVTLGEASRNRMALVPAICESFGIAFVGPDAFGRVICQDKWIAKCLANDAGLATPNFVVIRMPSELEKLDDLAIPLVLKPLWEGSSIGIGQRNLCRDRHAARVLAEELLRSMGQPIIAEQFEPGKEVSCNVICGAQEFFWTFSETVINDRQEFFDEHLFDAGLKYSAGQRQICNIDHLLRASDLEAMRRLILSIGKIDYCRVDGKWRDGQFIFLEITPDAWISPKGALATSYLNNGWSFKQLLMAIIKCSVAHKK